ncbi:hypothetical protein EV401DRAFT_1386626 [Pisolithus croceorrhizus]|nr:hypothetical protein EV401DRAFT_1386626 [Pisolithus croceorrhizus]
MYFQNPIWWYLSFARLLLCIHLQVLAIMPVSQSRRERCLFSHDGFLHCFGYISIASPLWQLYHIYVSVVRALTKIRQQCRIEPVLASSLPSRHSLGS